MSFATFKQHTSYINIDGNIDNGTIISFNKEVTLYYSKEDKRLCLEIDKEKNLLMTQKEYNDLNEKIDRLEKMILYMPPGGGNGYKEAEERFKDNLNVHLNN